MFPCAYWPFVYLQQPVSSTFTSIETPELLEAGEGKLLMRLAHFQARYSLCIQVGSLFGGLGKIMELSRLAFAPPVCKHWWEDQYPPVFWY